jgi:hypothetical protein
MVDLVSCKEELASSSDNLILCSGPSETAPKLTLDSFDIHRIIGRVY